MKAIIPVAGMGSRLRPHTHTTPKVLLSVAGKPILGHILEELVKVGVDEVTFIVGYLGDLIKQYVKKEFKIKVNFVLQEEMKGLGHAIYLTKELHQKDKNVLIILGDTVFKADLKNLLKQKNTTIAVREVEDPKRFGIVELDEKNMIKRMIEKPEKPPTNLAIVGIYYITNPKCLYDSLEENIKSGRTTKGEIQLTDALQVMLDKGEKFAPFKIDGWFDCGKPETLLSTNKYLLHQKNFGKEAAYRARYSHSVIIPPVSIAKSAKIENSIIGPDVSIGEEAEINDSIIVDSIIDRNAKVNGILLNKSLIGSNAKVEAKFYHLNVGDSSEVNLTSD